MTNLPHITESEWAVISKLWEESPLTIVEIVKRVQADKQLAPTTIKTLLRRLIAKNAVDFTVDKKNSKLYYYFPLLTEQECVAQQSHHFLSLYFKNDIQKLFSTYVDNTDLSEKELKSLRNILNKRKDDFKE